MSKPFIDVAAGLILKPDGQLLLAQRPGDKAWSGWWELPGGKIEPGETPGQALARELHEELGIHVTQSAPWVTYTHEYPKTIVRLAFHRVTGWQGEPSGAEGQAITWIDDLASPSVAPLLPATRPPLRWLQLPDRYLLTSIGTPGQLLPFLNKLSAALDQGLRLVQFREPEWAQSNDPHAQEQLYQAFQRVLALCHQHDARCLVNSVHPHSWSEQADGIHYRAADAASLASRTPTTQTDTEISAADVAGLPGATRGTHYVGMSVHTADDLKIARQIQADFAVLGHVLDTPSHPGVPGMGWHHFHELNCQAGLPVFAIGGLSPDSMDSARQAGAHGIAGMRQLIPAM